MANLTDEQIAELHRLWKNAEFATIPGHIDDAAIHKLAVEIRRLLPALLTELQSLRSRDRYADGMRRAEAKLIELQREYQEKKTSYALSEERPLDGTDVTAIYGVRIIGRALETIRAELASLPEGEQTRKEGEDWLADAGSDIKAVDGPKACGICNITYQGDECPCCRANGRLGASDRPSPEISEEEVEAALCKWFENAVTSSDIEQRLRMRTALEAFAARRTNSLRQARIEAREEWEPIETAPKDGTRISVWGSPEIQLANLGVDHIFSGSQAWVAWFANDMWEFQLFGGRIWPTHWRPLPPPPALNEKDAAP